MYAGMHPAEPGGESACAESREKGAGDPDVSIRYRRFLAQPSGADAEGDPGQGDAGSLYATGIRVSELVIQMEDINMNIGFLVCRDGERERTIPFGRSAKAALEEYLEHARNELLRGKGSDYFFVNCTGGAMRAGRDSGRLSNITARKPGLRKISRRTRCAIPLRRT